MTEQIGPGLRRRQLAKELTALRLACGMRVDAVAGVLGCARSRVSHLESSRNPPRKTDVMVLAELYGAKDRLPALLELWEAANTKGWWATYRLPSWMQAYVGLETDASAVRCFSLELVPGLLQLADYARDTFLRHCASEDEVSRYVAVRMERQRRLGELRLDAVISEALLARTIHMKPYGVDQLRWLSQIPGQSGVTLRVLPFTAGGHRSMSGGFTLLEFPEGDPVGYQENPVGGHLVDDQRTVQQLTELYEGLQSQTLSVEDSTERIRAYIAGTRS